MNIYKKINKIKMKNNIKLLIYFFAIFLLINCEVPSNKNSLRHLWEENWNYPNERPTEEDESLEHCKNSDYKYFSHVISGDKVTFSSSISSAYAVNIYIIYIIFYKIGKYI